MKVPDKIPKDHPQQAIFNRYGIDLTTMACNIHDMGIREAMFAETSFLEEYVISYRHTIGFKYIRGGVTHEAEVDFVKHVDDRQGNEHYFGLLLQLCLQIAKKTHELKFDPIYFKEVVAGHKGFELRLNDRNFQVGDTLLLREFDRDTQSYSGKEHNVRVEYILHGPAFGLAEGYCIMSVA